MEFNESSAKELSKPAKTGIFSIVVGALILATRAAAEHYYAPSAVPDIVIAIVSELVKEAGIAAMLLGAFNLILIRGDWEEYFEQRLKRIVIDRSYLEHLKPAVLHELVGAVVCAEAGTESGIDRPGGFLEYFQTYLHRFLQMPYREAVTAEMSYEEHPSQQGILSVHDKYSYTLRTVGRKLLDDPIKVVMDPQECSYLGPISVTLRVPGVPAKIPLATNADFKTYPDKHAEFSVAVPPEHNATDRIEVTIESSYCVPEDRFQKWWMPHPTRDLLVVLHFPPSYTVQIEAFVQTPELAEETNRPGYFSFRHQSWFLPRNGLAWRFSRTSPASATPPTPAPRVPLTAREAPPNPSLQRTPPG